MECNAKDMIVSLSTLYTYAANTHAQNLSIINVHFHCLVFHSFLIYFLAPAREEVRKQKLQLDVL